MGKVGGWIVWPVEDPSGPGGAAGAHSAHKAWAGTFGPRPCFGFAGPLGPQNAAAPRRDPTSPSSPSPARLRQPYGGRSWEAGRLRRTCGGGGGVFRAGAFGPGPKNKPAAGQSPVAGGWAQPTRRRPPLRYVFRQRQKGNAKARPHALWGRAHETLSGRVAATVPPPWAKPLPMPYGQRRLKPPRRGPPT